MKDLYKNNQKYIEEPIDLNIMIDDFLVANDRDNLTNRPRFFHPSAISHGVDCEYWHYLYLTGVVGNVNTEAFPAKLLSIMQVGTAIHDSFHKLFYRMGILEGVWECRKCGNTFWGVSPTDQCPECGNFFKSSTIKFKEIPMDTGLMRGSSDGILNVKGRRSFLEMKSIKNVDRPGAGYGFEALSEKGPNDDHFMQAQLYMDMWADTVREVSGTFPTNSNPTLVGAKSIGEINNTVVMYIAKNNSDRKLYVIKRDKKALSHLKMVMKKVWNAHLLEDPTDVCPLCPSLDDKEKKKRKCRFRSDCQYG